MGSKLLQLLEDVGYDGPLLESKKLEQAIKGGPKSIEYTALVAWFAEQLTGFNDIDETVHPTTTPDEASSFLLELSFFLKELGCVSKNLMTGHVNQRLSNEFERTFLIEFLAGELMASKILEIKCPATKASMEVTINESNTAKNLREMLMALQFQNPPKDITPKGLFGRLENKIKEILRRVPNELVGKSLFIGELSMNQWQKLSDLQLDMHKEYSLRRDMLLKRLDVTIQSFLWSERVKAQEDQLNEKYHAKRDKIFRDPNVTLADLLAARDDLAIIEKTSNAYVRRNTRSRINNVIIGAVPDRGGRPYEQEPPPPEMPPWQKDRVPQPQSFRGGRGGGGGGGRGGSNAGGGGGGVGYRDNKSATNNFGQNLDYQQSNRGYDNRGGYQSNNRGGGYQSDNRSGGYQSGNRGGYQQDNRSSGGYQGDTRTSGGYQNDYRSGGGYQADNRNSGDSYQRRDDNQGRSGRVQGGWNQSNNSSNYQRGGGGGYNRGGRY